MKTADTERGFTFVEVLLLVLIIAVISFGGYYVWNTNRTTAKTTVTPQTSAASSKTTTPSSTSASTAAPAQNYFTISAWGIRAPYNGSLSLESSVQSSDGSTYAYLGSSQLDAADPVCQSTSGAGGVIVRYASTDMVSNEDGSSSGLTPAAYISQNDISTMKYAHIGNYYYLYSQPQGSCSSSASTQSLQTQTITAFETIMPELTAY